MAKEGLPDTPLGFATALDVLAVSGSIGLASWKQYASAISWSLETKFGDETRESFVALKDGLERPGRKKRRLRRFFSPDVASKLVRQLRRDPDDELDVLVAEFIIASIATGLRPVEWNRAAFVDGSKSELSVVNAKVSPHSNSRRGVWGARGNGATRTLVFEVDDSGELVEIVGRVIDAFGASPWEVRQRTLRRRFKRALHALIARGEVPRKWHNLRLYDCRHQFAADAKVNREMLSGELAALMGHHSIVTASRAYGRKGKGGSGKTVVRPSKSSVAAVDHSTRRFIRGGPALPSSGTKPTPG